MGKNYELDSSKKSANELDTFEYDNEDFSSYYSTYYEDKNAELIKESYDDGSDKTEESEEDAYGNVWIEDEEHDENIQKERFTPTFRRNFDHTSHRDHHSR